MSIPFSDIPLCITRAGLVLAGILILVACGNSGPQPSAGSLSSVTTPIMNKDALPPTIR